MMTPLATPPTKARRSPYASKPGGHAIYRIVILMLGLLPFTPQSAWGDSSRPENPPPQDTSQPKQKESELLQLRRGIVRDTLQLEPAIARRFWPLYDAFQAELSELRAKRRELLTDLSQGVDGMSEAEAREYVFDKIEYEEQRMQHTRAYFRKLAEFMSYRSLAIYLQVETKIRIYTEAGIEESIPLIR